MIGGKVKRKSPIKKKRISSKKSKKSQTKRKSSPKKQKKPEEWTKWSQIAPKTKAQRQQLIQICGSTCFLMPNELKFPVCTQDCKVSCKGLIAARVRARQWNYPEVDKKVSKYYKEANCYKKKK
jgi:ferredoxin-like protein FixX